MFRRSILTVACVVISTVICAELAMARGNALTRQELEAMLQKRDAKIARLEATVNLVLERLANLDRSTQTTAQTRVTRAIKQESVPSETSAPETAALQARVKAEAPAAAQRDATHIPVDEEAAERALERTLVQQGQLLLPPGVVEIVPSFAYTFNQAELPFNVGFAPDGSPIFVTNDVEVNRYDAGLGVRVGLPLRSQLEVSLPYRWRNVETELGSPVVENEASGDGIGDLSVGLATTLFREKGFLPDVVARATWNTGTGDVSDDGVFLGGGFGSVTGSLNFVKRSDPLAFFGSVGYRAFYDSEFLATVGDSFQPGDQFLTSFGLALATSPETSLSISFDNQFIYESEVGGSKVDGSDVTLSTLNLGASTILSEGVLLRLVAGIGITDAAPDYSLGISIPVRTSALTSLFAK